ncbi:hypothetical protein [Immundisolibacter sp.]|jgi:hypothetical protein|uniref:hypothetical protein n=1 Tax=Immundisolibacter sp. TaxID=1934948 RepID=UPI0019B6A3A5|nr:hypothetical protein [Immundisolibacter sp.]MBC7160771.1 hypothetical protein [Immundisolibacter sp.]MEA3219865.1 hypothetical protein [Immundisolibacter sp.]
MTFRELAIWLENQLGTCHLLVNRAAKEPADLLLATGLHDRLVNELMRAVYKSNRCYHIRAAIQAGPTLAALQPVREKILDQPTTDLSTVRFLDAFDSAVRAAFGLSQIRRGEAGDGPGQIIPLPGLRRLKQAG